MATLGVIEAEAPANARLHLTGAAISVSFEFTLVEAPRQVSSVVLHREASA
jgi:hypothetical protein